MLLSAGLPSSVPPSWDCGISILGACEPAPTLLGGCVSTWTLDLADTGASVGTSFSLRLSWMTLMSRERRMGTRGATRPCAGTQPQHHSVCDPALGFERETLCCLSFVSHELQAHRVSATQAPRHTGSRAGVRGPQSRPGRATEVPPGSTWRRNMLLPHRWTEWFNQPHGLSFMRQGLGPRVQAAVRPCLWTTGSCGAWRACPDH